MKIRNLIITISLLVVAGVASLAPVSTALAAAPATKTAATDQNVSKAQEGVNKVGGSGNTLDLTSVIGTIINTVLFIVGVLSVVMIIYAGIRYQTAAGEAAKIKTAQNTLTYAIVGLIIAVLAYAIVNFILSQIH